MGKFASSWALMKASWNILKLDKEMLVFPFLSAIGVILVALSFVIPIFISNEGAYFTGMVESENNIVLYIVIFLFYYANYLVIIFLIQLLLYVPRFV